MSLVPAGWGSRHLQTTPGVLLVDGLLHLSSVLVRVAGAPAAGVSACPPPEFCPSSPSGWCEHQTRLGKPSPGHGPQNGAESMWARERRSKPATHRLGMEAEGPPAPWPPTAGSHEPWGTGITHAGVAGGLAGQRRNESQPWQALERKMLLKPSQLLGLEAGAG